MTTRNNEHVTTTFPDPLAHVVKCVVLGALVFSGLLTIEELSALSAGSESDADFERLLHRGCWIIGFAPASLASAVLAPLFMAKPKLAPGLRGAGALVLLGLLLTQGARYFTDTVYTGTPTNPNATRWKGALGLKQLAEAGELGWVSHPDLWPEGSTAAALPQRVARVNLPLLMIGDRFRNALAEAQDNASFLIEQRTRAQAQQVVAEIEAHAGPLREPYAAYNKARAALKTCLVEVDRRTIGLRHGDRSAIRGFLRKHAPDKATLFNRQQEHLYYKYRKTRVYGRDIPLFLSWTSFLKFWQPYLRERGATRGLRRGFAMKKIRKAWKEYAPASRTLHSQVDGAIARYEAECHERTTKPFEDAGLSLELDPAGFVLANTPAVKKAAVTAGLATLLDRARPQYGLAELRVSDLPFLESSATVREFMHERVRRVHAALFGSPPHRSATDLRKLIRATVGRAFLTGAISLVLVLYVGTLLALVLQLALSPRLEAKSRRAAQLTELFVPLALVLQLGLGPSPFQPGGDLDDGFKALERDGPGLHGPVYAAAIRSERVNLFLGRLMCRLPFVHCASDKQKGVTRR